MWKSLLYPLGFLLFASTPAASQQPIVIMHDFHITEGGGFINKTVREMGTKEFEFLVSIGCAALGGSCAKEASSARKAFQLVSEIITASGGNFEVSGRLLEHADGSEEWKGIFEPMDGYEICSAALNYGDMSITGETTFNVNIRRSPWEFKGSTYEGLSFYAVVPKNRQTRQWVNANFIITYVPEGTSARHDCQEDGTSPWLCKGQECNPLVRYQPKRGWIYLGKHLGNGQWQEPRAIELLGRRADGLKEYELQLNRDVNLRTGPFTLSPGTRCQPIESDVVGTLPRNSFVQVLNVVPFQNCTDYIWAEVMQQ